MSRHGESAKPTNAARGRAEAGRGFVGQGLLILLPVAILAVVGLYSLRQDRMLAAAEARQTSQRHVDELARVIWARLRSPERLKDPSDLTFQIDAHGKLVFPPPAPAVPSPRSLDRTPLGTEHEVLWAGAFAPATNSAVASAGISAAKSLLSSNLPSELAALVQYQLGVLLLADRQTNAASAVFAEVADRFPHALSEAGLPLAPLARFKALESAGHPSARALSEFGSNLIHQPTLLTPLLLDRARLIPAAAGESNPIPHWQDEWIAHEERRELARQFLEMNAEKPIASHPPLLSWMPIPKVVRSERDSPGAAGNPVSGHRTTPNQVDVANTPKRGEINPEPFAGPPGLSAVRVAFTWTNHLLATRLPAEGGGHWIACQGVGLFANGYVQAQGEFWTDLEKTFPAAPPWLGVSIELAGRTLVSDQRLQTVPLRSAGKGGGQGWTPVATLLPPEILATSRQVEPGEPGLDLLRVNAHLVSPDLLYGRQQARTRLFGLLISVSTLAALVGFIAARRAYHRQQRLAEMKSNFVSSVSHELRAPIASVRLLAESLERGAVKEPARQAEYFRFIVQECRRLGTLIENVLDFARIEQGRKEYEPEATDLAALIRQTMKLMEPAAGEKQVTLIASLPQPSGESNSPRHGFVAKVDPQAIQQALVNLIDNALKHSPPGSRVTVGLAAGSESASDDARVQLYVEDEGPGIPAEDHERIFERFYRRGSELRRDTQGVGIGLSIVKHIVEAHGGSVVVRSAPGQGSRFTIELKPC